MRLINLIKHLKSHILLAYNKVLINNKLRVYFADTKCFVKLMYAATATFSIDL